MIWYGKSTDDEIIGLFNDVVQAYLMSKRIRGQFIEGELFSILNGADAGSNFRKYLEQREREETCSGCDPKSCMGEIEKIVELGRKSDWIGYFESLLEGVREHDCPLWNTWCNNWGGVVHIYRDTLEKLEAISTE